jgi:chromosome partitioning protein
MSIEKPARARPAQLILVGNEKGGSGKSTVAMHIAISLIKSGQTVATIDLDSRQRTITNYINNRRAWAEHVGRDLGIPKHVCLDDIDNCAITEDRAITCDAFSRTVGSLANDSNFIVIDAPGHDSPVVRLAHSMADILVTPLNDSFIDLDVLAAIDPESFNIAGISHYAQLVQEARCQHELLEHARMDWIVLRNRLSSLNSRNKRLIGERLEQLSQQLDFRCIEGIAERVIFREFYPRGLTAVDDLNELTLGTLPTMSHITARIEIENLLAAIGLGETSGCQEVAGENRDAA